MKKSTLVCAHFVETNNHKIDDIFGSTNDQIYRSGLHCERLRNTVFYEIAKDIHSAYSQNNCAFMIVEDWDPEKDENKHDLIKFAESLFGKFFLGVGAIDEIVVIELKYIISRYRAETCAKPTTEVSSAVVESEAGK